jgi:hypothetical protein
MFWDLSLAVNQCPGANALGWQTRILLGDHIESLGGECNWPGQTPGFSKPFQTRPVAAIFHTLHEKAVRINVRSLNRPRQFPSADTFLRSCVKEKNLLSHANIFAGACSWLAARATGNGTRYSRAHGSMFG